MHPTRPTLQGLLRITSLLLSLGSLSPTSLLAQTPPPLPALTQRSGFENDTNSVSPFDVEIVAGNVSAVEATPFPAREGTRVHRMTWNQANYVPGSRITRGVEGRTTGTRITKEGWYAFSFYLPVSGFPADKNTIIAQMICFTATNPTDKTITVSVGADGALRINGYAGDGPSPVNTVNNAVLLPAVARGEWHDVVIQVRYSRIGAGFLRVWLNGAPESTPSFSASGISIGNGAWNTASDTLVNGSYQKWGMYCWDVNNYAAGESRTIYFDNIAYLLGNPVGAFDAVKPSGWGGPKILLAETFTSTNTGSIPVGWSVSAAANTSATVQLLPGTTENVLRLDDANSGGGIVSITRSFTAQTAAVTAEWAFRHTGSANWNRLFLRSGQVNAVELYTRLVGSEIKLTYRTRTGSDVDVETLAPNTWHDIRVVANPSSGLFDLHVNNVLKVQNALLRNPSPTVDNLSFGTGATHTATYLIDDITVEK